MRVRTMFASVKWAPAAVLVAGAVLAACGGDAGGSAGDLSEAEKSRIAEEYRDCMAEQGLDAKVDISGRDIDIGISGGEDTTEEQMLEADARCEPILNKLEGGGGPELSPAEEAELAEALLEVQRCVAEQGYVVSIEGNGIDLDSDDQAADFDEAVYLEVEDDCLKEAAPELYAKFGPEGG